MEDVRGSLGELGWLALRKLPSKSVGWQCEAAPGEVLAGVSCSGDEFRRNVFFCLVQKKEKFYGDKRQRMVRSEIKLF